MSTKSTPRPQRAAEIHQPLPQAPIHLRGCHHMVAGLQRLEDRGRRRHAARRTASPPARLRAPPAAPRADRRPAPGPDIGAAAGQALIGVALEGAWRGGSAARRPGSRDRSSPAPRAAERGGDRAPDFLRAIPPSPKPAQRFAYCVAPNRISSLLVVHRARAGEIAQHLEPALHGRPGGDAVEPALHVRIIGDLRRPGAPRSASRGRSRYRRSNSRRR